MLCENNIQLMLNEMEKITRKTTSRTDIFSISPLLHYFHQNSAFFNTHKSETNTIDNSRYHWQKF